MVQLCRFVSLLAATSVALAQEGSQAPERAGKQSGDVIPGAYIVEFEDGQDMNQFRMQAEPEYETRLDLNYQLFRGVSIQLNDMDGAEESAAKLASLPSVKNMWPVRFIAGPEAQPHQDARRSTSSRRRQAKEKMHKRQDNDNNNGTVDGRSTHIMTQVDKLHAEGITGKGIRIAIIDSGVDYEHPDLGGCYGEGCLVAFGHDLVGDGFDGINNPVPDDDPMDCMGHGTHVAGIVGAQGNNEFGVVGVAPGATLGMYRAFGCGSSEDVLIAAFNQAYEEDSDIINASVVMMSAWTSGPWAVAVSRIVAKGVSCTLSAGNDGDAGLFASSSASTGLGVTSVASFDNTAIPRALAVSYYTIDDGNRTAFAYERNDPEGWDGIPRPLFIPYYRLSEAVDACEPLLEDTPDLSDFHVLIQRGGGCDYEQKALNVVDKGGRFIIFYGNDTVLEWISVGNVEGLEGVAMVRKEMGESWVRALEDGSEVVTELTSFYEADIHWEHRPNTLSPGAVSYFSSSGPTFEMHAKPQFGAPGGAILSTYNRVPGGYEVLYGTSMSSPFVAGAYALVAEARGIKDPTLLENLLAATSKPQLYQIYHIPGEDGPRDWLHPPTMQGAGLIQVYDAVHASALLERSALSFNDTAHFAETLNFTLSNIGSDDLVFNISHVPTHTLYSLQEDNVSTARFPYLDVDVHAELAFSESEVTVRAGESVTVQVTATPPDIDDARMPLWSGYVAINGSDGTNLSLPYQGLKGSLHDAIMLGIVHIGNSTGNTSVPVPEDTTFTLPLPGTDEEPWLTSYPALRNNRPWGSPLVQALVVPLDAHDLPVPIVTVGGYETIGQMVGFPIEWAPKSAVATPRFNGQLHNGENAPAGRYQIVVRILRIFGDANNDDDWVIKETNAFNIRYESEG